MKKKIVFLMGMLCFAVGLAFGQAAGAGSTPVASLPVVYIGGDAAIHFISPEPIAYADVPGFRLAGDLPLKNVLRLKLKPDSIGRLAVGAELGVVTVVGESFMAQMRLVYTINPSFIVSSVELSPELLKPLSTGVSLTVPQMQALAGRIVSGKSHVLRSASAYGVSISLSGVYTVGDLVFLDISFANDSNLPYDIDELRFAIDDCKINKATNVQSVGLSPVWQLYPLGTFKRRFHDVFVLKKATFPGNKVLTIALSEKQVSGRHVSLQVKYSDILEADRL